MSREEALAEIREAGAVPIESHYLKFHHPKTPGKLHTLYPHWYGGMQAGDVKKLVVSELTKLGA